MDKRKNQNPNQWGQTRNALSWIIELMKNRKSKFKDVRKYMMDEEFTYMEKFDGTNIAKDKNGCIYTRRTCHCKSTIVKTYTYDKSFR